MTFWITRKDGDRVELRHASWDRWYVYRFDRRAMGFYSVTDDRSYVSALVVISKRSPWAIRWL